MTNPYHKKIIVTLVLIFLTVTAFLTRFENFQKPSKRTIDEILYYRLGKQLSRDITNYNALGYAQYLKEKYQRPLQPYFTKPLFKHPPLFSLLIAGSFNTIGEHNMSAGLVSITFGALMIPLIFFLGTTLFNMRIGILAAVFVYIDPISIMTAQKVWMDSTLAFFMVLTVFFFSRGLKANQPAYYLLAGIASGCALLTKYPGILATFSIFMYAAVYRRDLLKNSVFLVSLVVPFLMFMPWMYWNFQVYGWDFLSELTSIHEIFLNRVQGKTVLGFIVGLAVLAVGFILSPSVKTNSISIFSEIKKYNIIQRTLKGLVIVMGLIIIQKRLVWGLNLLHIPRTTWYSGELFMNENISFYLGKLTEFSLLYLMSFLTFFISFKENKESVDLLRLSALIPFVFFSVYGNFQSRYILPVIPLLIILGAFCWMEMFHRATQQKNRTLRCSYMFLLLLIGVCVIGRTSHINNMLSYTNDVCYF